MQNRQLLIYSAIFFILSNLAIITNIPIIRPVLATLSYLFIPGLIILLCLERKKLDFWKYIVYSAGLSVSFLMIYGLLTSVLLPIVGISNPISFQAFFPGINALILVLWLFCYSKNKEAYDICDFNPDKKNRIFIFASFILPILASLGAYWLRTKGNGIISLIFLLIVVIYTAIITIFSKNDGISKETLAFSIFMIAISLIFLISLESNHLFGCDVHGEYLVSKMTESNFKWMSLNYAYNGSLGVSLLPVIFSFLTGGSLEFVFKVILQIIFALVPIIIFLLLSKYTKPIYAFLAAFFFMSFETFPMFLAITRSETAFLFVALSFLAFFDDEIEKSKKALFLIFAASIVLSHSTVSYIFLGALISLVIAGNIEKEGHRIVTATTALLFFALIFFWYGQVITTPFNGLIEFTKEIFNNLANVFISDLKSGGAVSSVSIPNGEFIVSLSRYVSGLMKLFILLGLGFLALNWKKLKIDREFVFISIYSFLFVVLSIFLPLVTKNLNIERVFLQSLMVLCFCCILGMHYVFEKIRLKERLIPLFSAILITIFFLFQSGAIFMIAGAQTSPALSKESLAYRMWNINDLEIVSAEWLAEQNPEIVYGDHEALLRLWGYGQIMPYYTIAEGKKVGHIITENLTISNSFIYLRQDNVKSNSFLSKLDGNYNYIGNFTEKLSNKNKVYDNGVWIFR